MTTVDILLHYAAQPSENVVLALAGVRDVYGIRALTFDRTAQTLRVEYDATRLNAATVTGLVRQSGLEVDEELSLLPVPAVTEPAPAA
ncbi:MAG TPA: hypothetical protein VGS41_08635 [Chthonomonadales bacterium]|nr:hypothetical protein [Chthonomonadales bacterium]